MTGHDAALRLLPCRLVMLTLMLHNVLEAASYTGNV